MCTKIRYLCIILCGATVLMFIVINLWTKKTGKYHMMYNLDDMKQQSSEIYQSGSAFRFSINRMNSTVHDSKLYLSDLRSRPSVRVDRLEKLNSRFLVCPDLPYSGLGNQMFGFASCLGIADTLGYNYILKSTFPLWKYFQIKKQPKMELTNLITLTEGKWRDENWKKNSTNLSRNLTLTGYFQAWTYFKDIKDELRKYFTIKPQYLERARQFIRDNVPGIKTTICVHVRRGDFLYKSSQTEGRTVADKEYINKSMNFFRKKYSDAYFIIVSEDVDWCWNNIFGDDFILSDMHFSIGYQILKFGEAVVDLSIMSLCDHAIITSGTFGWWGGWLSGGTVIYLKDFPRPGSQLDQPPGFIREEYYLPDWIGMSNGR